MKFSATRLRRRLMRLSLTHLLTFGHRSEVPERNILLGYAVYMTIGFLLLLLPWSTKADISWLDNLFTAASALSTTGLSTVDTGAVYTLFGQAVILFLIQLGAVGYMTVSSYVLYRVTHHSAGVPAAVTGASISVPYGMKLRDLVNNIVHFTLIFEVLGAVSFYFILRGADTPMPAWNAVFLSISSFCTAGFSPFSDSLCAFSDNIAMNLTVAVLSYAGAMGFIVITDLIYKVRRRGYSITFTSKVIFLITAIMTVGGTVILAFSPTVAGARDWGHRLLLSFFQTMSAMTTVGYNTVDLSTLRVGPILVFSLIMFIGASPSGTGGGVKCTSVSAVWGFVVSKLGLRPKVTFLGRAIPSYRVETALASIIVYGAAIFIGSTILSYTEPYKLSQILFETTSAIGTVGLSTGITADLSVTGKCVLIVLMYMGRVGVITVGSAMLIRTRRQRMAARETDLAA